MSLFGKHVKLHYLNDFTQQCVEHFFRKRVWGRRRVKPVRLHKNNTDSPPLQNKSMTHDTSSDFQDSCGSRDEGRPMNQSIEDPDSVDYLLERNKSLQARLLSCLDDDGITFDKPNRTAARKHNKAAGDFEQCGDSGIQKYTESISYRGQPGTSPKSVKANHKTDMKSEVPCTNAQAQSEKERLSMARRNLWKQAHANAANKSYTDGSPREDICAQGDSLNVTSPEMMNMGASHIMTSSPMRGVQQQTVANKRSMGRGIRTLKMLIARNENARDNSPGSGQATVDHRNDHETEHNVAQPNIDIVKVAQDKHMVAAEGEQDSSVCGLEEALTLHQVSNILPETVDPFKVNFMHKSLEIEKQKQEYFDSCSKGLEGDAEKENGKNDTVEDSFTTADENTASTEGEVFDDPLITCDISPIVPTDPDNIENEDGSPNKHDDSSGKISKEHAEYSSFIYSCGSSAENTTHSASTLQIANKSSSQISGQSVDKHKYANDHPHGSITQPVSTSARSTSSHSATTDATTHLSGSTMTESDHFSYEPSQNDHDLYNPTPPNQYGAHSKTTNPSTYHIAPQSPVQVNLIKDTYEYEQGGAINDSQLYWNDLEQEEGDVVVEEEEDIYESDEEPVKQGETPSKAEENWT